MNISLPFFIRTTSTCANILMLKQQHSICIILESIDTKRKDTIHLIDNTWMSSNTEHILFSFSFNCRLYYFLAFAFAFAVVYWTFLKCQMPLHRAYCLAHHSYLILTHTWTHTTCFDSMNRMFVNNFVSFRLISFCMHHSGSFAGYFTYLLLLASKYKIHGIHGFSSLVAGIMYEIDF